MRAARTRPAAQPPTLTGLYRQQRQAPRRRTGEPARGRRDAASGGRRAGADPLSTAQPSQVFSWSSLGPGERLAAARQQQLRAAALSQLAAPRQQRARRRGHAQSVGGRAYRVCWSPSARRPGRIERHAAGRQPGAGLLASVSPPALLGASSQRLSQLGRCGAHKRAAARRPAAPGRGLDAGRTPASAARRRAAPLPLRSRCGARSPTRSRCLGGGILPQNAVVARSAAAALQPAPARRASSVATRTPWSAPAGAHRRVRRAVASRFRDFWLKKFASGESDLPRRRHLAEQPQAKMTKAMRAATVATAATTDGDVGDQHAADGHDRGGMKRHTRTHSHKLATTLDAHELDGWWRSPWTCSRPSPSSWTTTERSVLSECSSIPRCVDSSFCTQHANGVIQLRKSTRTSRWCASLSLQRRGVREEWRGVARSSCRRPPP